MPERTALASIEWTSTHAVIRDVICPASDNVILDAIERADKSGIDCPFGWPDAFVEFVTAHRVGHVDLSTGGLGAGWRRELTMRRTDAFVRDKLHVVPLSVSADKIAHVACAARFCWQGLMRRAALWIVAALASWSRCIRLPRCGLGPVSAGLQATRPARRTRPPHR